MSGLAFSLAGLAVAVVAAVTAGRGWLLVRRSYDRTAVARGRRLAKCAVPTAAVSMILNVIGIVLSVTS